jgi:hypothetical protein
MDSENRFWAIVWGFISATIVAVVFITSTCVSNDSLLDSKNRQMCTSARGDWVVVSTSGESKYGCKFK